MMLSVLAVVSLESGGYRRQAILFLLIYLAFSLALLFFERSGKVKHVRVPVVVDVIALSVFWLLSPMVTGVWLFYFFVSFATAVRGEPGLAAALGVVATASIVIGAAIHEALYTPNAAHWAMLGVATIAVGASAGFLGARERRRAREDRFLENVVGVLQVERGLAESIRLALDQIAGEFESESALIAARDDELERVFVWKVKQGQTQPISPEAYPHARADSFLADNLETSICWNSLEGSGKGFGWRPSDGKRLTEIPRLPESSQKALGAKSFMAVALEPQAMPARLMVLNGRRRFVSRDLRWLEQIARSLGPPLENLFQLRHLRARAVEADRSRISRDLHDGILQTLLSLKIQLDVLRRKIASAPEQADADLSSIQDTVQKESDELRRMVTDLRPVRIESADLVELMTGFAERFRNEATLAIDLFLETRDLRVPDRVCRELFQIYRESLHNIKKHARASHVVVKLWQDETKVFLVVDDNGQGFSFAGRYTSEELDRLRLGPISIKERTRSVGGMLTVESTPGHGAQLTVEIPLN